MKVAVIVKLNNGCDFYRCVLPVEYIPFEKGSFKLFYNDSIDIPEDQLDFADNLKNLESFNPSIIFFSRTISNNNDLDLLEVWKNKGIKIVMDIDDYWEMGTSNYLYKLWYKTEMNKKLINNMKIADLVITTNEQLYEKIIPINRNCIIIPNAVPFGEPYYCKDENIKVSTTHRKMNFLYNFTQKKSHSFSRMGFFVFNYGWSGRIRTSAYPHQKQVPYRLATLQLTCKCLFSVV